MAQETELKFIISDKGVDTLRQHLNTLNAQHTPASLLHNIYYETSDNWLRAHDMGLRIRGENGRYEMTLKTAGRMVGGLHQRPEYNIPLEKPELALSLIPREVWPQGELPAALTQNVAPLFSTDFTREKWQVREGESQIEIALDSGVVKTARYQETISELELELLSGQPQDLLTLAHHLLTVGGLRQGSLSKAARGYHLVAGNDEYPLRSLAILPVAAKVCIEQGLESALESALAHWLYHDEVWARGNPAAKVEICHAIARIRHTLVLFGGIVPRKATAALRAQLTAAEVALEKADNLPTVLFDTATVSAKLTLTAWLESRGWRAFLDPQAQKQIAGSFKRFADIQLSRTMAELKSAFQQTSHHHYDDQLPRLARAIESIQLLAGAYPAAGPWLSHWQGLYQAITHKNVTLIDHFRHQALATAPFWLHSGK